MTAAAQTDLRVFAADEWPLLNHKGRLRELCRLLPWSNRRVRAVYNGEAGVTLRANEADDVAGLTEREAEHVRSQAEYRELEARIAALEAYFAGVDEDYGRPEVEALRAYSYGQGAGVARSGAGNGPVDPAAPAVLTGRGPVDQRRTYPITDDDNSD